MAEDISKLKNLFFKQPFDQQLWKYKSSLFPESIIGYHKITGPYYYYILDWEKGKFVYLSDGIKDFLGYDDAFWEKGIESVISAMHPEDIRPLLSIVKRWMGLMSGKSVDIINKYSSSFNFRMKNDKGEYVNLLLHFLYMSLDKMGNVVYDAGVVMDITRYCPDGTMTLQIIGPDNDVVVEYAPKKEIIKNEYDLNSAFKILDKLDDRLTNPFLRNVKNTIHNHFRDDNFRVEALCSQLMISRTYLYRKLKELVDVSPNQLIMLYRMREGVHLLMQHEKSIAEIAYSVGFKSPAYFTKCFHDLFNLSPSRFKAGMFS